jgi:hypothetical protein
MQVVLMRLVMRIQQHLHDLVIYISRHTLLIQDVLGGTIYCARAAQHNISESALIRFQSIFSTAL